MNESEIPTSNRVTVINALAVAGFVALMALGMWLAVYSTRYVPNIVGRMGAAAVYLGSVFTPSPEASLVVIPETPTTISFGEEASSTLSTSASSTAIDVTLPRAAPKPVTPTAGTRTTNTYQIGGATTTTNVATGLPDLMVKINAIGYLATSSAESFVASSTVPTGKPTAIHFTIKNIGTNVTGPWRWSAFIPTQSAYTQESQPQQSLAPGDSIEYWLGFDYYSANKGLQTISVTANFDKTVKESNEDNNTASTKVTISY